MIGRLRHAASLGLRHWRAFGTRATAAAVLRKIARARSVAADPLEALGFVLREPFGPDWREGLAPERSLNWIVPDFVAGLGGHVHIFKMAAGLETRGWRTTLVIDRSQFPDAAAARRVLERSFTPLRGGIVLGVEQAPPAWGTVATSWPTAYAAAAFRGTARRFYFVQDYEPWFYPQGSEYALAEHSYRLGLTGITAGDWLAETLRETHGMTTHPFHFTVETVPPLAPRRAWGKRVLFYVRPSTARRCTELGLLALSLLARRMPELEVVTVGWDLSHLRLPFRHENLGVVPAAQLPALYRRIDAALVLSATNVSLLPLELMAEGCPVVSNRGPNVTWQLDAAVAELCDLTPDAIAAAVERVLTDPKRRESMVAAAHARAAGTRLDEELSKVERALKSARG